MEKIPAKPKTKEDFVAEKSIFELLAWYQPLHKHTLHDYGIYLTDAGIVKLAESLQLGLTAHNVRISRKHLDKWKLLKGVAAYIWTKSWPNLEELKFKYGRIINQ